MAEGRVTKNTAYLVSAFVGQKVLSFLYFTVIARTVGVEGAGRYFVAVSFTTIFSVFIDLGLSNVLVREVAKIPERARSLLANVLGLKIVLAVLTVAAANAAALLLKFPEETRVMIAIASGVMVLDSIHLIFYAVMRGFQNLRYEAVGVVSGQAVTILAGGYFLMAGFPLPFLTVALLCGSAWNVLWAVWSLARRFGVPPSFRLEPAIVRFFRQVTVPFALAGIFSRVYSYIDSIMLSKLISESSVGLYGVAYKIAFAFQFVPMSFAAAVYPAMSEYHVSNREKLGKVFTASLTYLMVLVAPIALGIATLAKPLILAVYGEAFLGSVLPLRILMFSLIFAFLYWPAGSLLNACDRQAANTRIMGITMVSNIAANALLVPKFAATGAAAAALLGNGILFGGAMLAAMRIAPIDKAKTFGSFARIALAALLMAAPLFFLQPYVHVAILVPLGAALYAGAVIGTGGMTVSEIKTFFAVFLRKGKRVSDIVA